MHTPPPIPPSLAPRLTGWTVQLEYSYGPETATWRLERGAEIQYLKIAPVGREPSLAAERERMRWAAGRLPVPAVLGSGFADRFEWLLTAGIPGRPGTDERFAQNPCRLVEQVAQGLRALHETPAADCPFDFRLDAALAQVRDRVAAGRVDPVRHLHPEHRHLTPESALAELEARRPASEDVVLCHGDSCLPNVLLDARGVVGYVDLGELALADRWWDLAVATWSLDWNLGPGWEARFLDAYGVAPDRDRRDYFRLLYDLAS